MTDIEQIIQTLEQQAEKTKQGCNPNQDYDRGYMAGYYSAIFDLKQLQKNNDDWNRQNHCSKWSSLHGD